MRNLKFGHLKLRNENLELEFFFKFRDFIKLRLGDSSYVKEKKTSTTKKATIYLQGK